MDKVVGKLTGYIGKTIAGNFHRKYILTLDHPKQKKPPGQAAYSFLTSLFIQTWR